MHKNTKKYKQYRIAAARNAELYNIAEYGRQNMIIPVSRNIYFNPVPFVGDNNKRHIASDISYPSYRLPSRARCLH